MMKHIDSNSVSLAGEFAVLSQLSLRGFDANMTLGHTKGVDILVFHRQSREMFKIEVKTTFKETEKKPAVSKIFGLIHQNWILGEKNEEIVDPKLFYCFVSIDKETKKFHFYIVPSAIVAKYVKDENRYWLSAKERSETKGSKMRLFRLGVKGCDYKLNTPIKDDFEDRWDLIK